MRKQATRRSLVRSLFLVLGLLPTLAVSTWAVAVSYSDPRDAARLEWQRRVTAVTGLTARIASVEPLRDGATALVGLQLLDPETGAVIAETRRLLIVVQPATDGQSSPTLALSASQPTFRSAQLPTLWHSFEQRVLKARSGSGLSGTLSATEVVLEGHAGGETYTDVQLDWQDRSPGPEAVLSFRVPWLEMKTPAEIRLGRNREFLPPQTELRIKTGPVPLPCSIFADFLPPLRPLGTECRFRGTVQATSTVGGWLGEWQGEFHEVDLESVVSAHFPHTLRGQALVGFEQGSFRSNRLVAAKGWLDARDGVIGTSLVRGLAEQTGSRTPLGTADDALQAYSQLRFAFTVSDGQLRLHGNCSGTPPGTILSSRAGGVLWTEPPEAVPVVALVRAVVPASQVQVPATEETHWLLDALPLPRVVALPLEPDAAPAATSLRIQPRRP